MARSSETYLAGKFTHRRTEGSYMCVLLEAVTLDDWRDVVGATLAAAKAGDAQARTWLAQYLMGKAAIDAPAPMRVVAEQLSGRDPLVEKLAEAPIQRIKYPDLLDDRVKERVRVQVAAELKALAALKPIGSEGAAATVASRSANEAESATHAEPVS